MTKPNLFPFILSVIILPCNLPLVPYHSLLSITSSNSLFLHHFAPNRCSHVFSFYLHLPPPASPFGLCWLNLSVDLRRTDIQRPVPCLQHWHFCQTLMAPLNRDVWREELPVSPPSSNSSSALPPHRVRCAIAGCSSITHAQTYAHRLPELCMSIYKHIWAHLLKCSLLFAHTSVKMHMVKTQQHTQSYISCWDGFKIPHCPPLIKLAHRERQRNIELEETQLSQTRLPNPLHPSHCCSVFKNTHVPPDTL